MSNKPLRLIYAGTPEFSVPALHALHKAGHDIIAVLTQPDRPAGRGRKLTASPVKQAALDLGLEVLQPLSLRKAAIKKELRRFNADAMIVAAYGLILPQSVLDMPRLGCLNIHASLLPCWRGAAPIHRAIEAGDETTGITIMQMDAGLDTGDMLSLHPVDIEASDTSLSLHDKLAGLGAEAIVETLDKLVGGEIEPQKQNDDLATYASKLHKSEAQIDWSESAETIARKVRAFNPWPCTFTYLDDQMLKVWSAEPVALSGAHLQEKITSDSLVHGEVLESNETGIYVQTARNLLCITELQLSGKKRMPAADFINSTDLTGKVFGTASEN